MTRDEPKLFDDTRDLMLAFIEAEVDFIVVGAHALAAHGLPRATAGFDVLVRASPESAPRVMNALATFGAPTQAHGIAVDDFVRPGAVYQLGLPPRRIDILTQISGVTVDEAWESRLTVQVGDLTFAVLGRDALMQNKRATGRPKDLLDVRALEGGPAGATPPNRDED